MANIPPEIWFHIAKFIPNKDVRDLLGVNRVFFNIAMDIRYREIMIGARTPDQDIKTLKRISDPLVASRVYRLSLRLTHVNLKKTNATMSASNIRCKLKHTIVRVFGGSKSHIEMALTELINEVLNITNKLVNVRELYIDIWDPPPLYDLQRLFSSFLSSFGPKLYTLYFGGVLEDFRTFINSNPTLGRLRDLRVELSHSSYAPIQVETSRTILVDLLLPFINNLAPHLLSLRLCSWAHVDLSTFFSQLAPFPRLKALNVRTQFNNFGDASGLKGLICKSSDTLQSVCLHLNRPLPVDGPEERLSRWLLECISDERFFSNLQVLDIYPTNTAAGMEFLYGGIQRTSRNLAELIVRDRCLQDHEVKTVIDAASSCHNLTYLRMNISGLGVALIDRMALELPQIKRLWLSIEPSADDRYNYYIPSLNSFLQDLDTRLYTDWKLEDISIWQNGREGHSIILSAFARSIPSLTSFFSTGHVELH